MYVIFSHLLAFATLFIASIFDLKTSEVPDHVSLVGVIGGIGLHFIASLKSGFDISVLSNLSVLLNQPLTWFQALGEPLMWSITIGVLFSVFGWGLYFMGMWGGADAFAMSVLGFAAPTSVHSFSVMHSANLFMNIMYVGFVYSLGFALYRSWGSGALRQTYSKIKQNELKVSGAIIAIALISSLGAISGGFNPLAYFLFFSSLVFVYYYMKVVQDDIMKEEVDVSELEGGEVLAKGELEDDKVRGIREEEIDELDTEKVVIRDGVRFIPVFPVALLITDLFGGGVFLMQFIVS